MKGSTRILGFVVMILFVFAPPVLADADIESDSEISPTYSEALNAVAKKDYRRAVILLERELAENERNADAFNTLGFSHRMLGDLDLAVVFYLKALAINPDHRGAHEYLGETYLKLDQLAKAREHLARLDDICWLPCEQYTDLKAAIKRYETTKQG